MRGRSDAADRPRISVKPVPFRSFAVRLQFDPLQSNRRIAHLQHKLFCTEQPDSMPDPSQPDPPPSQPDLRSLICRSLIRHHSTQQLPARPAAFPLSLRAGGAFLPGFDVYLAPFDEQSFQTSLCAANAAESGPAAPDLHTRNGRN